MPTFAHGKGAVLKVADNGGSLRDVSNVFNSTGLSRTNEPAETTAFGSNDKSYIPGLRDATLPLSGMADTTVDGYLAGILGHSTPVAWELFPMGSVSGYPKYSGSAILTSYETSAEVGGVVAVSGELQVTGAITRATV